MLIWANIPSDILLELIDYTSLLQQEAEGSSHTPWTSPWSPDWKARGMGGKLEEREHLSYEVIKSTDKSVQNIRQVCSRWRTVANSGNLRFKVLNFDFELLWKQDNEEGALVKEMIDIIGGVGDDYELEISLKSATPIGDRITPFLAYVAHRIRRLVIMESSPFKEYRIPLLS